MDQYFNAGNGYVWGVRTEPDNFQLMGQVMSVGRQVDEIHTQMQEGMDEIAHKMELINRKKRKSCLNHQMAIAQDGAIILLNSYDDGTRDGIPFIMNIYGKAVVYQIHFMEEMKSVFFGIYFSSSQTWVIGRREKLSKNYLHDCFVRRGISFNSQFSEKKRIQVLYEFFTPQIEQTDSVLTLSALAGWNQGKYYHANNFPFAKVGEFSGLPVLKKQLVCNRPLKNCWESYFKELNNFKGWEDRAIIMIFPFWGLVKSILREEHCEVKFALNFVKVRDFSLKKVGSWIKVLNRESLFPVTPDGSDRAWTKLIKDFKDETVFVDFSVADNATAYEKKKCLQRWQKTLDFFNNHKGNDGGSNAVLGTISTELKPQRGVYNLILDDASFKNEALNYMIESEIMERIFSEFVSYIEDVMDEFKTLIKCDKYKKAGLSAVWRMVKSFWMRKGISINKEINLPDEINFQKILDRNYIGIENLVEMFVQAVRKEASNFYFIYKNDKKYNGQGIVYDEEFLWISTVDLHEILQRNGVGRYLTRMLLELKGKGYLETEEGRLTKKVQVQNIRKTGYQIKRELFNALGRVDIVELGKGGF